MMANDKWEEERKRVECELVEAYYSRRQIQSKFLFIAFTFRVLVIELWSLKNMM